MQVIIYHLRIIIKKKKVIRSGKYVDIQIEDLVVGDIYTFY